MRRDATELPEKVDPQVDAERLRGFGIDPDQLARDVPARRTWAEPVGPQAGVACRNRASVRRSVGSWRVASTGPAIAVQQ